MQIKGNSRRQKNTKAAKNSRERKKIYVKLLEESINDLESELFSLNSEVESLHSEIFNAVMHIDEGVVLG